MGADKFDVVLLDLSLPDSSGIGTFHSMQYSASDIPIVILTGQADEELALDAMNAGAQDYLHKGVGMSGDALVRTVRYAVERHRQQRAIEDFKTMLLQAEAADSVGHEIDGPLAVISGLSKQLSEHAAEDHPLRALSESLQREVQRIEEIVGHERGLRQYGVDAGAWEEQTPGFRSG